MKSLVRTLGELIKSFEINLPPEKDCFNPDDLLALYLKGDLDDE